MSQMTTSRKREYMRDYRNTPEGHAKQKQAQAACLRRPHPRFVFARYKAKERGLVWELTEAEHVAYLASGKCHYCRGPLPETSAGLDRTDNSKGYVVGNVVPCCHRCNTMKGSNLTYDEMIMVWERRRLRGDVAM